MKNKGEDLYRQLKWIELVLAVVLVIALIFIAGRMLYELWSSGAEMTSQDLLNLILANAFMLVIGAEFIKMIIKPTAENVLEVIMLTITRALIMDHSSMMDSLIGILGMLVLFIIRKHFFCEMQKQER